MPRAIEQHTPSRRGLLNSIAGATAAAGILRGCASVPALAAGPDAELIALCADLARIGEKTLRLDNSPAAYARGHTPEYQDYEAEATDLDDAWYFAMERMRDLPATSPAGLRAKASAMRLVLERCVCSGRGQSIADLDERGEHPDRFAWSLARDVLAMGA